MLVSFAYMVTFVLCNAKGKSFMCIKDSSGPRHDPCGTKHRHVKYCLLAFQRIVLDHSKSKPGAVSCLVEGVVLALLCPGHYFLLIFQLLQTLALHLNVLVLNELWLLDYLLLWRHCLVQDHLDRTPESYHSHQLNPLL